MRHMSGFRAAVSWHEHSPGEHHVRVHCDGPLTHQTAWQLDSALRVAIPHAARVVVDLRDLDHLDIDGVQSLLIARLKCHRARVTLRVLTGDACYPLLDRLGLTQEMLGREAEPTAPAA